MGNERDIADNVRKLIGAIDFDTMLCTVVSVDGETTCTVKSVKTGAEYKNIKLNANINDDKGIYVFPKKNSYVLVTMIDKVQGIVSMYSDIERITLKIDDTVEVEIGGNATIQSNKKIRIETITDDLEIESGKMLSIKNKSASLGDVLSGLIQELISTTVVTPAGPGNINPANVTNFTQLLTKSKSLLK